MDSDDENSSPYLTNLRRNMPKANKPVTINIENPLNLAPAYPSQYIGIDAKKTPEGGKFPVKMANEDLDAASLDVSALKPGSQAARIAARASKPARSMRPFELAFGSGIDAAPGRKDPLSKYQTPKSSKTSSTYMTGLLPSVASKRKRDFDVDASLGTDADDEADAEEAALRKKIKQAKEIKYKKIGPEQDPDMVDFEVPFPERPILETFSRVPAKNKSTSAEGQTAPLSLAPPTGAYDKLPDKPENESEADQYLMTAYAKGRVNPLVQKIPLKEMATEWKRISGYKGAVDESWISCRHIMIQDNYAKTGQWDDKIFEAQDQAGDIVDGTKLWDRVERVMLKNHDVYLRGHVCRRRFFSVLEQEPERDAKDMGEKAKKRKAKSQDNELTDADSEDLDTLKPAKKGKKKAKSAAPEAAKATKKGNKTANTDTAASKPAKKVKKTAATDQAASTSTKKGKTAEEKYAAALKAAKKGKKPVRSPVESPEASPVGGRYVGVEESLHESGDELAGSVDDLDFDVVPRPTRTRPQRLTRKSSDVSSVMSGDKEQADLEDEEYDSGAIYWPIAKFGEEDIENFSDDFMDFSDSDGSD